MFQKIKNFIQNRHTLSLAGNGTSAIMGFVSLALVARLLDKSDMGSWFIFLTAFTFVDMLRSGIIHTSLIRFAASSDRNQFGVVAGSGWFITLIVTTIISVLTLAAHFTFGNVIKNQGFNLFLEWYWLAGFTTIPFNYAAWLLQARQEFDKVLYIRLLNQLSFMFCVLLGLIFNYAHIHFVLFCFILSSLLPSFLATWAGWSWIKTIRFADKKMMKELFNFGKFSMGTLMGSNLLRSSDTLIIGFLMTAKDVAAYSLPLKLVEIIEIPLRSFLATAMPVMSKYKNPEHKSELRYVFYRYAGLLSVFMLPAVIACIFFAEPLVTMLGGNQYAESAIVLRILAVYTAFLPLDRFSGVTLDIIGKPKFNFIKVLLMLLVNVVGDIIAIKYIGNIWAVAGVSILTFLTGVIFGNYILKQYLHHTVGETLRTGTRQAINLFKPVLSKLRELRGSTTPI